MIPVKLALRNFMSYTDIHEPLVFDGIHLACLSGENGAGKSALLDAITWVLWGQSRARTTDQLVHAGRSEMEVELEFVLAEANYRVIRKRSATGRGSTILDLAVRDGETGQYRSISGNSVPDTEKAIEGLLRMSYTTFTNSSFILQGRADSFTTRTPAERKQVLADILELAEYDRLQDRARREVQQRELRHRDLEAAVREADAELGRRLDYLADQERLSAELAELEGRIGHEAAELERLRDRLGVLAGRERELAEALAQVEQTRTAVVHQAEEIAGAERVLVEMRGLLEREREIERGYAELVQARKTEAELNEKLAEFVRLCDERNRLDKHVATERTRLETELAGVEQRLARAENEAARLREHEQEVERATAALAAHTRARERREALEREQGDARERVAELRGAKQRLRGEMNELKGKIDALQDAPICPICRSPLDQKSRESLTDRYSLEGRAQRVEYNRNLEEERRLEHELEQRAAELEQLGAELGKMLNVERRLAAAEQAVGGARRAVEELDAARTERGRLRATIAAGQFARREVQMLEEMCRRLDALGYDEGTHVKTRQQLRDAARYENDKRELDGARQAVTYQEQMLDQGRRSLAGWQERLDVEQRRADDLREQTRELPALRAGAAEAERALADLRRAHGETNRGLGEAQARLRYLEQLEQQRRERLAQMAELLREKALYGDLATAFGKNGIQAMIIETAIPEIEDEANRLLGSMTEGRMHVKFETQRAARAGDSTIETLDIVINDELGPRPYELYSGGEAFRANFAIRIALSRLLARRAGARLQTLVIDEGFGSQDEGGRERLVEAINSVADQFAMILVITHLEDLKERFPTRIEVRKTVLGSILSMEWAD